MDFTSMVHPWPEERHDVFVSSHTLLAGLAQQTASQSGETDLYPPLPDLHAKECEHRQTEPQLPNHSTSQTVGPVKTNGFTLPRKGSSIVSGFGAIMHFIYIYHIFIHIFIFILNVSLCFSSVVRKSVSGRSLLPPSHPDLSHKLPTPCWKNHGKNPMGNRSICCQGAETKPSRCASSQ